MPESNVQPIDASTRLCAIFGSPIRHSASPVMHNAAFAALGLNWRYVAFEVLPGHLPEALRGARRMGFAGLNLTVPHKLLALDLVDELDDSARTFGAVNTIVFHGVDPTGRSRPLRELDAAPLEVCSRGFNTDAEGLARSLREDLGLDLPGSTALLLGAGGAGRAAALKLASSGVAWLYLVNRTESKAREIASDIQARYPAVSVTVGYPESPVDLALNATSLGLRADDPLPFDPHRWNLRQARSVYDMVYHPAETPFLKAAIAAGCRSASGFGMLLHQGAAAFELWTGHAAPVDVMREALFENIYGTSKHD